MTFHLPAEWTPHELVWIGFPSHAELWLENLAQAQAEVAAFAKAVFSNGHGESVQLVAANKEAAAQARDLVGDAAEVIVEPFGDIWLRDTGPIIVIDGTQRIALDYPGNGWGGKWDLPGDDTIGRRLAASKGIEVVSRQMIFEGGAIDVDGAGMAVTTRQCVLNGNRNPQMSQADIEGILQADFGLKQILWLGDGLANDHTDGHVDNIARFVAPGVLAIPAADSIDDPNAQVFADALAVASEANIHTTLLPSCGRYAANKEVNLEVYAEVVPASYMNFYIGNAAVVVPIYGRPNDDAAVAAISKLFPGRQTVGLSANHILTGGGSFHCISQQVPKI